MPVEIGRSISLLLHEVETRWSNMPVSMDRCDTFFSRTFLIDVHVGWISSATHDPDKPREPPVVVLEVAVMKMVNAAAQRIGAGEIERSREAAIHSCLPAEFINETSGRRRRRRRRRGFTREDGARTRGGARRSVPQSLPAGSHASTRVYFYFWFTF